MSPSGDAEYHRQRRARIAAEAGRPAGVVGRPVSAPCGTVSAYKRHQRHGEAPCAACRAAWAEYHRERYRSQRQ